MEKKKYELTRDIEGIGTTGDIVELTDEEFGKAYKNVTLNLIETEGEAVYIPKENIYQNLRDIGLSHKRATAVSIKFCDLDSLISRVQKGSLDFDRLTNELLLKEYGMKMKSQKKKKNTEVII